MAEGKKIKETKFDKIRWLREGEAFKGSTGIYRAPYGMFNITFTVSIEGRTVVEIENSDFPSLYWKKEFSTYNEAKAGVITRFGEIEKLIEKAATRNSELRRYYCQMLNEAVQSYEQ